MVVTTITVSPTRILFCPRGVRIVPFRLMQQIRRLSFRFRSISGTSGTSEASRMENSRASARPSRMLYRVSTLLPMVFCQGQGGLIELHVKEVQGPRIVCLVLNGGELGERKGVNVPGVKIKLPALTEKDKDDIRFGMEMGFD